MRHKVIPGKPLGRIDPVLRPDHSLAGYARQLFLPDMERGAVYRINGKVAESASLRNLDTFARLLKNCLRTMDCML